MKCPHCRSKIPLDANVCAYCGHDVQAASAHNTKFKVACFIAGAIVFALWYFFDVKGNGEAILSILGIGVVLVVVIFKLLKGKFSQM
ncbi:MAG: zinc ribbon domain-containing protein [Bacteroidota bacterium]